MKNYKKEKDTFISRRNKNIIDYKILNAKGKFVAAQ